MNLLLLALEDGLRLAATGAAEFIRYAAFAGMGWLFFYVVRRRQWIPRKIIEKFPPRSEVRREIILSILTCGIYAAVGMLTWVAVRRHLTQIYFDLDQHSTAWFWTSIVLSIVLHDTYFYWTHRLMHMRRLFPIMHKAHHLSVNPTPWAAYAFDPWEAVLQACIFPIILFSYPIHLEAFLIFMVWQVVFNVLGHAGFEIFPSWFLKSWPGKFLNTPTNHAMHHQYFRSNYGLYFNFWDRWMGTNHESYEERFHEVTTRADRPAA